jgi:hypothetical protein
MDGQFVNGSCDLSEIEPGVTSAKSRQNSRRRLADDREKAEPRRPAPRLSETDYLLSLWQSDCAELRQAGVELRLEKAEVEDKPAVILTLLEVNFCPTCQTFHGTTAPHTCIR